MKKECTKCRIDRYIQWVKDEEKKRIKDYGLRKMTFGKIKYN